MADPSQIEDLLTAVRNGEKLTVSELLDSDALDAYIEQNGGKLLLEFPSCEIAELLILKGANVDAVCEDGKTLLNKAASRGDVEIMHLLMFYGATKWNCCVDGRKFFKRLFANSLLSSQLLGKLCLNPL
jgi:ankyrin repeat protein